MKPRVAAILLLGLLFLTGCTNPLGPLQTTPTSTKPVATTAPVDEPSEAEPTLPVAEPPEETPVMFEKNGIFLSDQPPDACGEPQPWYAESSRDHHARIETNGNATFWGPIFISFKTPEDTTSVTAQWYQGVITENPFFDPDFEKNTDISTYAKDWVLVETSPKIIPSTSCKNNTYAHVEPQGLGVEGTNVIPVKGVFSIDHAVVAEIYFFIQQ